MSESVTVFAPATVSNVACGFDIFGFPLLEPGDEVVARKSDKPGVSITKISGDGGSLPYDAARNTAGIAAASLLAHSNVRHGIELELHKKMPLGSGLGSSAASAVAAVIAVNLLLGERLTRRDLLPFVLEAERIACGSGHADNAAPALLGGFVIIRSYAPLDIISIPTPKSLVCTVIHPHMEINTGAARKILNESVPLKDFVAQTGNACALVSGLILEDFSLISRALVDTVIEKQRAKLIPAFYEIKRAALEAGALGSSISGSGPSVFALCRDINCAEAAGKAMQGALDNCGIASDIFISPINTVGPRVLA